MKYQILKHAKGLFVVNMLTYVHAMHDREVWSHLLTFPCYKDLAESISLEIVIPELEEDQRYVGYTFKTDIETLELVVDILLDSGYSYNIETMKEILKQMKEL